MDIYPTTSEFAHWTITADVDLTTATAEVFLEGEWRAMEWVDAGTEANGTWTRTARIRVAGADAPAGLVITGSVRPEYRISTGGEVIVRTSQHKLNLRA